MKIGIDIIRVGLELIDKLVVTKEEKERLKLEFLRQQQAGDFKELEVDMQRYMKAHDTYQKDATLQKSYALSFLVGFFITSGFIIWIVVYNPNLSGQAIAIIGTVSGVIGTIITSIVDFLFGSSLGSKQKTEKIAAMKEEGK